MRDELLAYYERELTFLRQLGAEFAEKYPKVANRLVLEPDRCEDPHVERLLEGFAFLAARVHLRIDDDFPEISESLLSILYPHYIRPVPSMTVAEFHLDPNEGKMTTGFKVDSGSTLYSRPVGGIPCKFRTSHDLTMWPLTVAEAQWRPPDQLRPEVQAPDAVAVCRLKLACLPDVQFKALPLSSLRFYLNGESALVHTLYELLFNSCTRIIVRDPNPMSRVAPVHLPASSLKPVGFREEEALLPSPRRSFAGYRLLQEYFALPERFFFIELTGLEPLAAFESEVEILFLIGPFERNDRYQPMELGLNAKTFRLNCSPIVNLFSQTAEPVLLDQTRYEYPVIPDLRRRGSMEVFSIDQVFSSNPDTREIIDYEPFYSLRHVRSHDAGRTFWHATRHAATKKGDAGSDVMIGLLDLAGRHSHPDADALTVKCTCTNRDLPSQLPFGDERGDFELEGSSMIKRIVSLRKPTPSLRPAFDRSLLWRKISHFSLNYLSLVEEGREALQEILRLYNYSGSAYLERQIDGIRSVKSRRHFGRVVTELSVSFVRGTRVEMEIDEDQFVGGGVFLFASVLEYFLGLYVSMNSFSQLVVRTPQRKEALREWQPRAGRKILL
ncbi:MAG TPA: type VI secretion system baseplate subunit TssF [Bryobacteraceae bacterium]|nr:type VI secretion system baseplate subunit TssF [Bryobacteraceae bacterium]